MPEPLWINYDPVSGTPQYDANEMRQAMALALQYGGRAVGARQGVRPGGNQLQVSLAGSTITVQPGLCCVDPALNSTQGPYWVAIPVPESPVGGPLAAADATNPRKDIVVARVYDHDQDASGLRLSRSEYRAGAAGPTPSLPAVQAGELLLATIDVPKAGNGAAVVTNVAPFTVASGGILPLRTQAEEDAVASVAYAGMAVWRIDLRQVKIHDGTAFQVQGVLPAVNYNNIGGVSATFTSGAYADVPGATTTIVKSLLSTGLIVRISASGQSAQTGFTVNYGVSIGGVDYSVTVGHIGQATIHVPQSGERRIPNIGAGSVTVKARCRVNGTGFTYTMNASDAFTMTVQEVG